MLHRRRSSSSREAERIWTRRGGWWSACMAFNLFPVILRSCPLSADGAASRPPGTRSVICRVCRCHAASPRHEGCATDVWCPDRRCGCVSDGAADRDHRADGPRHDLRRGRRHGRRHGRRSRRRSVWAWTVRSTAPPVHAGHKECVHL